MRPDLFPQLADACALVFGAFAAASQPPEEMTVDQWAAERRFVAAESGSSRPGKWSNDTTPYAIEPMQVCSPADPARRVAIRASAQTLKSELILNVILSRIDTAPRPMMLVLPSINEVLTWNRTKWRPNVKACPTVDAKVTPERSRDETSSTVNYKHFIGGMLMIATASSSKELQARSAADLFMDEVSEFPSDTKGRGDPVTQARARQHAWGDQAKELSVSTPKDLPDCRISAMVEAGDWRRFYVPCPHCGHFQLLLFDNFDASALQPTLTCAAHGCIIEETAKGVMNAGGVWLKTYPDGENNPPPPPHMPPEEVDKWRARPSGDRQPSFDIWQVYSTLRTWAGIAQDWREAQGDPTKLKTFYQQVLAQPYDGGGEAPDFEKIWLKRDPKPSGGVPFGYWIVTGAADVQGNRLEYGIWAWGPGGASIPVETGIIMGDPSREDDECWRVLGDIRAKSFEGENGHRFEIDRFGVDSGFLAYNVYRFCNRRPNTLALDGRGDRFMAPIGVPKVIKAAPPRPGRKPRPAAIVYPVGTYGLKQRLYQGLNALLEGPDEAGKWQSGAVRLTNDITLDYVKQMTAEALMPVKKPNGRTELAWAKIEGRANEALDIWVYNRALASHLGIDGFSEADWEAIAAQRGGAGKDGGGLEEMWSTVPKPAQLGPRLVRRTRGARGKVRIN